VALDHGEARAPRGEPERQQRSEPERPPEPGLAVLQVGHRALDDREGVLEDVDEEEGQHADREHREPHPGAVAEQLQAPERQSEVDREPGERAEQNGLRE